MIRTLELGGAQEFPLSGPWFAEAAATGSDRHIHEIRKVSALNLTLWHPLHHTRRQTGLTLRLAWTAVRCASSGLSEESVSLGVGIRKVKLGRRTLALIGLLAGLPYSAVAAPITFGFTGTATGGIGEMLPGVNSGDPTSGTITFDSDVPDVDPDPNVGWYPRAPLAASISFPSGSYSLNFVADEMTCTVAVQPLCGSTFVGYQNPLAQPAGVVQVLGPPLIGLSDDIEAESGSEVSFNFLQYFFVGDLIDDSLPMEPPPFRPMASPSTVLFHIFTPGTGLEATRVFLDDVFLVPEASTGLLVSAGLLILGVRRRRYLRTK